MSVMVHARRSTQVTPPMVHERGGARTVSTTLPYEEMGDQVTEEDGNQLEEHYLQVNHAVLVEGESNEEHACNEDGAVLEDGDSNGAYEAESGNEHGQGMGRRPTRSRSPLRALSPQQPAAMVHGGVLYMPDEQTPTERALRRHRRLMARVDIGDREPVRPPSQDGSSTPSDALLTCCAWPLSPPPALTCCLDLLKMT